MPLTLALLLTMGGIAAFTLLALLFDADPPAVAMQTDWTQVLLALISMLGLVLGPIVLFFVKQASDNAARAAVAAEQARTTSSEAKMVAQASAATSIENGKKSDVIIEKATEIHTLTNSNLSKVTASLDVALVRIDGLTALVANLTEAKVVADKVAETAAAASVPPAASTAPQTVVAAEPLPVVVVDSTPVKVETEAVREKPKAS